MGSTIARMKPMEALALPMMPAALTHAVNRFRADEDMMLAEMEDADIREARIMLPVLVACCAPATPAHVQTWMEIVALSVGMHAPEPEQRNARIALVMETCGDLPAGCWTPTARVYFARTRGARAAWFPTDGEVDAILRPYAWRMKQTLRAIQAIVAEGDRRLAPAPAARPVEEVPINQLAGEARDAALAHVRSAVTGYLASRLPHAPTASARRSVALSGRALWQSRNDARVMSGLPPLPEPKTFDGYGKGAEA